MLNRILAPAIAFPALCASVAAQQAPDPVPPVQQAAAGAEAPKGDNAADPADADAAAEVTPHTAAGGTVKAAGERQGDFTNITNHIEGKSLKYQVV